MCEEEEEPVRTEKQMVALFTKLCRRTGAIYSSVVATGANAALLLLLILLLSLRLSLFVFSYSVTIISLF